MNSANSTDFENRSRKANLAKLLASENISVVHKNIPTAYFDVKNRVLGLYIPVFMPLADCGNWAYLDVHGSVSR